MSYKQHHVWYLAAAWGHLTSANALINRMLHLNPSLLISVVTHAMILDKLEADYAQYSDLPRERLHLLAAGAKVPDPSKGNPMVVATQETHSLFLSTLAELCSPSSTLPYPTSLIFDVYGAHFIFPQAKEIVGPKIPTFMHVTQGASAMYTFFVPTEKYGFSDWEKTVERIYSDKSLRAGRDRAQIIEAVALAKNGTDKLNGTVLRVPGVKEMYDYEREGYNIPMPPGILSQMAVMANLADETDGIIISSSYTIEGPVLEACKEFKKVYPVGTQIAPFGWEKGAVIQDEKIRGYLDKQKENSVL